MRKCISKNYAWITKIAWITLTSFQNRVKGWFQKSTFKCTHWCLSSRVPVRKASFSMATHLSAVEGLLSIQHRTLLFVFHAPQPLWRGGARFPLLALFHSYLGWLPQLAASGHTFQQHRHVLIWKALKKFNYAQPNLSHNQEDLIMTIFRPLLSQIGIQNQENVDNEDLTYSSCKKKA